MALNDLIAQGAQFAQAPDPFRQYAVMQQLEQGQQTNALNRMKMQEAQRGLQEQNQLRALYQGGMDMSSPEAVRRVAAISPAAAQALGTWQTKQAGDRATAQRSGADAVGTALKNSRMMLDGISTPEQYMQWHLGNHSDPVLGDWLKQRGVTAEKALQQIQQAMQTPGGFEQLLLQSKIGSEKALESHFAQFDNGSQIGQTVTPKYGGGAATVVPGSVQTKQMTPGQAESNAIARGHLGVAQGRLKLAQSEAAKPPTAASAATEKPLTALQQQKLRKDMAADDAVLKASNSTATELEKLTDELVGNPAKKIKAHPGLGGITGWSSLIGNLPETDASKAQQKLETFKSKISSLGRSLATQDGKLGNMAVQEWKIVTDAVQNIRPSAGNLDQQMLDVVRQAKEFATRQKEKYDLTYENADALIGNRKPAAPAANPIDALLDKYK